MLGDGDMIIYVGEVEVYCLKQKGTRKADELRVEERIKGPSVLLLGLI